MSFLFNLFSGSQPAEEESSEEETKPRHSAKRQRKGGGVAKKRKGRDGETQPAGHKKVRASIPKSLFGTRLDGTSNLKRCCAVLCRSIATAVRS